MTCINMNVCLGVEAAYAVKCSIQCGDNRAVKCATKRGDDRGVKCATKRGDNRQ
jgi:hypothetical protein